MTPAFIIPDWPAPEHVHACTTPRHGGISLPPYNSFNLGDHVGDKPSDVEQNRQHLIKAAGLPESPRWLSQHHGVGVINSVNWTRNISADGIYTRLENHVCPVMTADCLPILICHKMGNQVAAVHAGWRGLANGIIEQAIGKFKGHNHDLLIWLGPAIGPTNFEVGHDVVTAFTDHSSEAKLAFKQTDSLHFMADIYLLARQRLNALGVTAIYGGNFCTVEDNEQFFSYRRDKNTGRMASLIWIAST